MPNLNMSTPCAPPGSRRAAQPRGKCLPALRTACRQQAPTRFIMLEEWADTAALRAHEATPHFLTLVAATDGKVARIDVAELSKLK
jgi:hypothetical protein